MKKCKSNRVRREKEKRERTKDRLKEKRPPQTHVRKGSMYNNSVVEKGPWWLRCGSSACYTSV